MGHARRHICSSQSLRRVCPDHHSALYAEVSEQPLDGVGKMTLTFDFAVSAHWPGAVRSCIRVLAKRKENQ